MKTRPILLGIITLVTGFILGMLTSAQLRLHKLQPVRFFFSEERFKEGFYKTIQPDDKQRVIIDQIISKYASQSNYIQGNFRKEIDANFKAMRKELDSNLTKDQLARIKEMDERRQEMMKQERIRHEKDTTRNWNRFRPQGGQMRSDERQGPPMPPPIPESDSSLSTDRK